MGIINVNSKDTITSINGKTGVISKADLAAMDIPIDILTNKPYDYRDGLSLPTSYPVGHTMFVSTAPPNKFNNINYCVIVTIRGGSHSGIPTTQYLYPQMAHGPIYIRTAITGSNSWSSWKSLATTDDIPTSLPANGGNAATVNGKTVAVNVPAGANFNDTVTTINGKTGAISKADIVALGIPAQDTDKKTATFVVGNTGAGHTLNEVDFLCTGTNDQVPIQQAIDALPSGGGKIVVLEGTYQIYDTIDFSDKHNVCFEGVSHGGVILSRKFTKTTANGTISWNYANNIVIKNIKISADNGFAKATDYGISRSAGPPSEGCIIENCIIERHAIGIRIIGGEFYKITNNHCFSNISHGMSIGCNRSIISENRCRNNGDSGIVSSSTSDMVIINNACMSNNNRGILIMNASYHIISNNCCRGNDSGIYYSLTSSHSTISGNTCNNNVSVGILIGNGGGNKAYHNTISGNKCNNNNIHGILLGSGGSSLFGNTVSDNICNNNMIGIKLDGAEGYNTGVGNTCIRGSGKDTDYNASQYTIQINASSQYNLISSNNCMGKAPSAGGSNTVVNNKSM